jgi:hypothetical protein
MEGQIKGLLILKGAGLGVIPPRPQIGPCIREVLTKQRGHRRDQLNQFQ